MGNRRTDLAESEGRAEKLEQVRPAKARIQEAHETGDICVCYLSEAQQKARLSWEIHPGYSNEPISEALRKAAETLASEEPSQEDNKADQANGHHHSR